MRFDEYDDSQQADFLETWHAFGLTIPHDDESSQPWRAPWLWCIVDIPEKIEDSIEMQVCYLAYLYGDEIISLLNGTDGLTHNDRKQIADNFRYCSKQYELIK